LNHPALLAGAYQLAAPSASGEKRSLDGVQQNPGRATDVSSFPA